MCGLCLPHCPTYRSERQEAESPRGRIALARALTSGRIEPTPAALAHLDHCLACLSCQKVCPSEVQYDEIITHSRADLRARRPRPDGLQRLLRNPGRLVALARLGAFLRAERWLPSLLRRLPLQSRWRALAEDIPVVPVAGAPHPATKRPLPTRGRVILFRGCVASIYDRDTHAAAQILLEALGYEVVVPPGSPCCGALARHAGETEAADRDARGAREALTATGGDTVLVSASGCFGDLRDHVLNGATSKAEDVHAFLARDERFADLRFRPLAMRAALHLPCTQVNVVGEVASIRSLLARIPGLTLMSLPEQPRCCGAAGSYFIEQPEIANRLRAEKLDQVEAQEPELLLTTNIGCRIHLGNGLRQRAAAIPVRHPLALLAQQLDNANP
jgi:glycolate oxidase iron-sulfur subunit